MEKTLELVKDKEEVKTTSHLSNEEIIANQKKLDEKNIEYIQECKNSGLIDAETADFLSEQYSDSMEKYSKFVFKVLKSINFNKISKIQPYDLDTGEVIDDGLSYRRKDITPNTPMVLTILDSNDNKVKLYLPGMKSVKGAISKVKKGGQYDKQYQKDLESGEVENPKKPYQRLYDINRCHISAEFKSQLFEYANNMADMDGVNEDALENRFVSDIQSQEEKERLLNDAKNRRELKGRYGSDDGNYEVQYNVGILSEYDKKTHGFYEIYRAIDGSTPYGEVKKNIELQKIGYINGQGVKEYNNSVKKKATQMLSDFEFKPENKPNNYKLNEEEQKCIANFLIDNLEARKSYVFNLETDLPECFKEYDVLTKTVKNKYVFNNSEDVYNRKPHHPKPKGISKGINEKQRNIFVAKRSVDRSA